MTKENQQFNLEQPGDFTITLNKAKTNENQRLDQTRAIVQQVRSAGDRLDLFELLTQVFIAGAALALLGFVPASLLVRFWSIEALAIVVCVYVLAAAIGLVKLLAHPLTWRRRLLAFGVVSVVWLCFCGALNYAR
jgi:hypothetical protein